MSLKFFDTLRNLKRNDEESDHIIRVIDSLYYFGILWITMAQPIIVNNADYFPIRTISSKALASLELSLRDAKWVCWII
jgi:hypothetical protein